MEAQASVVAKMRSLEEELRMLRSQIAEEEGKEYRPFSALEGVWRGKVDLTMEEIRKHELKLKEGN